jgi:hypothetical protein
MEPRPAFHPVYVSGQYLTSEHLNETQEFLWQEEKATRYLLVGNGIAQGLSVTAATVSSQLCVKLSPGEGVTVDGYLVELTAARKADPFHYFNKVKEMSLVLFTTSKDETGLVESEKLAALEKEVELKTKKTITAFEAFENTVPESQLPTGAKLVADAGISLAALNNDLLFLGWVDISDAKNDHCKQGDCNTMGTQRNYTTRYFLVKKTDIEAGNSQFAELPLCNVVRIKNLSSTTSTAGFNQKVFDAWNGSSAVLAQYFQLKAESNTGANLETVALLCNDSAVTASWTAAVNKFKTIIASVSKSNCPQYYTAFADDLAKAINELVGEYNLYVRRYPVIGESRIERTLLFGQPNQNGLDKWRYYFIEAVYDNEKAARTEKVKALLQRVLDMVNSFIPAGSISVFLKKVKPVLVYPTHKYNTALLEDCSIAAYFDTTKDGEENALLSSWSPRGGSLQNVFCFYDSVIPHRKPMADSLTISSWDHYNFFRVEGHVGMLKLDAIAAISKTINDEGIPLQLLDCDVNYKGPQKWYDWFEQFGGLLQEWVPKLRTDVKVYEFDRLKKIQLKAAQTSYRNVDDIVKVANDFYAYANVFYSAKPTEKTITLNKKAVRAGAAPREATMVTGIPDTAVTKFKEIVPKQMVEDLRGQFNEAIVEQTDLQTKKLVTLKDLQGLEYAGGAPRGGTFVLLHDGSKILGDGALAHYYRIDQARVWAK